MFKSVNKCLFFLICIALLFNNKVFSQSEVKTKDASDLMLKLSEKYKTFKTIEVDFSLTIQKPKPKPEDADSKYTTVEEGKVFMKGGKFRIVLKNHEIICDGKNIWTYAPNEKEVQVNYYEKNDETFSPDRIFNMYKEGYSYQVKEKKTFQGKNVTVVEMAPVNRKVSFFKIDVGIEEANLNVLESKIYEKSGTRYIYKLNKTTTNTPLGDDLFNFDVKKYPGVNLVDLR